jgi:hypothetical protein
LKLIFIYGLPATGKLTVAQQLAEITGYKLFHNHLAVDMLLPVFDFGSEPFVELREQIWLSVFEHACRAQLPGLIFTFNPEVTVRQAFIDEVLRVIDSGGGEVIFVELTCPIAEMKQRMDSASRLRFRKLTSVPLFEELLAAGSFDTPRMPPPRLSIDTSLCTPTQAATGIARQLALAQFSEALGPASSNAAEA